MSTISVLEIQQDPSAFVRRLEAGEALLVVRDEQPLAEVRPVSNEDLGPRPYGLASGKFAVPVGFDDPLPEEVLGIFEGR